MAINRLNSPVANVAPEQRLGGVVDIYCKIDGVEGEALDSKHQGWIHVEAIAGGVANAGAFAYGGGGGSGKAQWQDITIRGKFDKCFATMMQKCATGEHIGKVEISACKAGGDQQEFLNIKMEDVIISSLNLSGAESTEPMFDCGFNFAKVTVTGKGQDSKGNMGGAVTAGYNIKLNQKI
ncbi:type VI secretion system secreted protein Hcp [Comamonas sp. BIGb0152]|uniref:Hcp family type VI secretion system effector n=1 Tax=Comamonas sp. BIGb0152 TaxID=2940601 RepID=UPI0021671845|nr:type VI secretion system tube protein Hcp [Comamonas sp. BIGb0152]MCS4292967.1 type VI secretion system secreted protein Hcp [Comamonas sp. BIGb0152]